LFEQQLYLPAFFVNQSHLFSGEGKTIGDEPEKAAVVTVPKTSFL
jgi:hypothetical protein